MPTVSRMRQQPANPQLQKQQGHDSSTYVWCYNSTTGGDIQSFRLWQCVSVVVLMCKHCIWVCKAVATVCILGMSAQHKVCGMQCLQSTSCELVSCNDSTVRTRLLQQEAFKGCALRTCQPAAAVATFDRVAPARLLLQPLLVALPFRKQLQQVEQGTAARTHPTHQP